MSLSPHPRTPVSAVTQRTHLHARPWCRRRAQLLTIQETGRLLSALPWSIESLFPERIIDVVDIVKCGSASVKGLQGILSYFIT